LFLSILGLIDVDSGSIVVDGINLASLPREYCRTQIVAIPQEPYLLDGSVRENVDPHYQHDKTLSEEESKQRDQQIQSTLEKVGLWKTIEARGGLTENMDSNSLSQGQMQLFMLARAMMRQTGSRLLLIDEATSR
jgi:ABC-type multidrug transport system fused ATPase/permease subunit